MIHSSILLLRRVFESSSSLFSPPRLPSLIPFSNMCVPLVRTSLFFLSESPNYRPSCLGHSPIFISLAQIHSHVPQTVFNTPPLCARIASRRRPRPRFRDLGASPSFFESCSHCLSRRSMKFHFACVCCKCIRLGATSKSQFFRPRRTASAVFRTSCAPLVLLHQVVVEVRAVPNHRLNRKPRHSLPPRCPRRHGHALCRSWK